MSTDQSSLPARGAWIEIFELTHVNRIIGSRSPLGERGLKSLSHKMLCEVHRRSPLGERGLKLW